jgi:hypothetical protein
MEYRREKQFAMRSKNRPQPPGTGLDPGLVALRSAGVIMAATLACFFSAWLVEDLGGLHAGGVVLAVVLGLSIGRTQRHIDPRGTLVGAAVLPAATAVAAAVGLLLGAHPVIGDVLFATAVAAAIFVRRFGAGFARAGTQATLPLVAVLVVPLVSGPGLSTVLWTTAIAVVAYGWVTLARLLAGRAGVFTARGPESTSGAPTASMLERRRSGTVFGPASTRMAVQMFVGLGAAFVIGHWLFPGHWSWVVLTAFVVASGNRSRRDVVRKSGLRVAGAACGTVFATLLASVFPPGDRWTIVAIFTVLALASWLREFSYGYWAAGVTAALALLYGYFGEHGTDLLVARLEGILIGAVLAVAASWFIAPVRTARARPAGMGPSRWGNDVPGEQASDGVAPSRRRLMGVALGSK